MSKVAIIGNTSWGTTLGAVLARKGLPVNLWTRTEEEAQRVNQVSQTPNCLAATSHIGEAVEDAALVIWVVPAQSMRENVRVAKNYLEKSTLLMSAAKGLEVGTGQRMSLVMAAEIAPHLHSNICVLSGPNLSREVAQGLPAASVIAATRNAVAEEARSLLTTPELGIFTSDDVIGVELGGALKNIIALGAGMADGLELGDNAKAAFIARGWSEMTVLGTALGADPLTFSGLAGLGDLVATCASPLSRNHYVGEEIAKGRSLAEITAATHYVAEGVSTSIAARNLGQSLGVTMPITDLIYHVLFEGFSARKAMMELLTPLVPALSAHTK